MKTSDFDFDFPEEQIATQPSSSPRVMFCRGDQTPVELSTAGVLTQVAPNDVIVINDTKVVKKRVFTPEGLEILFLDPVAPDEWTVLMPSKKLKLGEVFKLSSCIDATLLEKGLPQKIQTSEPLGDDFFEKWGQMALPPYIQKARGQRQNQMSDEQWYQTQWARTEGSSAAPTASLHFKNADWENLQRQGTSVLPITLHVGLGTFLPVHTDQLNDHQMHSETVEINHATIDAIKACKRRGGRVWALGTTVTRALESLPRGYFQESGNSFKGETDIFIYPGFEFQIVDVLMTNFHQPKSTLLALVSAFAGRETTLHNYHWAIERGFRLFSYGDLSVWTRS